MVVLSVCVCVCVCVCVLCHRVQVPVTTHLLVSTQALLTPYAAAHPIQYPLLHPDQAIIQYLEHLAGPRIPWLEGTLLLPSGPMRGTDVPLSPFLEQNKLT